MSAAGAGGAGSAIPDGPRWRAILWDLDGTLVDTGRDLATAVNEMLRELGVPPLSIARIASHVGKGARNLVTRCLEDHGRVGLTDEEVDAALSVFERFYDLHLLDTSRPFDGLPDLLARLRARGERMAVVTNKPAGFSQHILRGLGLDPYFAAVVGGDSTKWRKPDPEPLLTALAMVNGAGVPPVAESEPAGASARRDDVVMVGDTPIDIEAARNAGMRSVAVSWGFATREVLASARPDVIAGNMAELAAALLLAPG